MAAMAPYGCDGSLWLRWLLMAAMAPYGCDGSLWLLMAAYGCWLPSKVVKEPRIDFAFVLPVVPLPLLENSIRRIHQP